MSEHRAFPEGSDPPAQREQGTAELLDALGTELERLPRRPAEYPGFTHLRFRVLS